MEIIIKEQPAPMFSEHTVFEKINLKKVQEDKLVYVTAMEHTKTRVHTSLQVGRARYGINWKIDGYNTAEKQEHSFWTYEVSTSNYFVSSKKQNKVDYFGYIAEILKSLFKDLNIDTLTVIFYDRFKNWK